SPRPGVADARSLPGNVIPQRLDSRRNRFSELLYCRGSGPPSRPFARLLRLDLVSAPDDLCRRSQPVRCVSSANAPDDAPNRADGRISCSDRQTNMAVTEPGISRGHAVDVGKSYQDSDRVHSNPHVSRLRIAAFQFPAWTVLHILIVSADAGVLLR